MLTSSSYHYYSSGHLKHRLRLEVGHFNFARIGLMNVLLLYVFPVEPLKRNAKLAVTVHCETIIFE